jgi:hypothetical protein
MPCDSETRSCEHFAHRTEPEYVTAPTYVTNLVMLSGEKCGRAPNLEKIMIYRVEKRVLGLQTGKC